MKGATLPRKSASLPATTQLKLSKYALAASAAGVATLALSHAAEAKIVYTPANVKLVFEHHYGIDLNNDGTTDVTLNFKTDEGSSLLLAYAYSTKGDYVVATQDNRFAQAMCKGAKIGESRLFRPGIVFMAQAAVTASKNQWYGPWAGKGQGVKNHYLGIKFTANNKVHYGWVRLTAQMSYRIQEVKLTGYAYETVPNKPIIAGKTTGRDVIVEPATLGRLARGKVPSQ